MLDQTNQVFLIGTIATDVVPTGSHVGYRFKVGVRKPDSSRSTFIAVFMLNDVFEKVSTIKKGSPIKIFGRIARAKNGTCVFALDAQIASENLCHRNDAEVEGIVISKPYLITEWQKKSDAQVANVMIKNFQQIEPPVFVEIKAYNEKADLIKNVNLREKLYVEGFLTGPLEYDAVLSVKPRNVVRK